MSGINFNFHSMIFKDTWIVGACHRMTSDIKMIDTISKNKFNNFVTISRKDLQNTK